jgi:hypothetical protein
MGSAIALAASTLGLLYRGSETEGILSSLELLYDDAMKRGLKRGTLSCMRKGTASFYTVSILDMMVREPGKSRPRWIITQSFSEENQAGKSFERMRRVGHNLMCVITQSLSGKLVVY